MPSSLATLRARLQIVLDDAAAVHWTTAELDEHLQRGLRDLSHWLPRERKSTLATVSGNRDLDISTLAPRVRIAAIEHPTGNWPRTLVAFAIWADTLTFLDDEPDGGNADIYWEGHHLINGTNTLDEDHDETLLFIAAAMACDQQAADLTNELTTGARAAGGYGSLARHFRTRYEERRDARKGIGQGGFYATTRPTPSQATDAGP